VPDWIYDALQSFQTFMDKGTLADSVWLFGFSTIGTILLVAIHECGHAVAVLFTGHRVHELRVGHSDDVTVTAGGFRLRLGRLRGEGDVAGYVRYDAASATPRQVLTIALAGPAANVLAAAGIATLAARAEGMFSVVLFLWALTSSAMAVSNLRPAGDRDTPAAWSDGRWVQVAWAARRTPRVEPPLSTDPNTATSVAPPSG
jgi:hypothetical protein